MNPHHKFSAGRLMAVEVLAPYFRAAIHGLQPIEKPGLDTYAVTKSLILYYDLKTIERESVVECATSLVHEVGHWLRNHFDRGEGALWNVAGDLELNDDLEIAPFKLPACCVFPRKFKFPNGLTAEQYLVLLEKNPPPMPQTPKAGAGWCGSAAGHPIPGEPAEAEEGPDGQPLPGAVAGMSQQDQDRVRRQVAEDIKTEEGKGRGTVPGNWVRWANVQLTPPKVRWEAKLQRAVRNACRYRPGAVDYRRTHISKRQGGIGYGLGVPLLPALRAPVPEVAAVMDTSGSMGAAEGQRGLSEIAGLLKTVGQTTFLSCDATVHGVRKVSRWQELIPLLKGGGGTNFVPAFDAIQKLRPRPEIVVFLTDGDGTMPPEQPRGVHVIWVLVGERHRKQMPWGEVVVIDD